jgi:hypothetical protein
MARPLEGIVLSEQYELKMWDPNGDSYVQFQRPSRFEAEQIATMQARSELVFNDEAQGEVRQRDRVAIAVLQSEMVALTLVECNIPDEDGNLLFSPGKSCRRPPKRITARQKDAFYEAWHRCDDDLCEEIIEKLKEFHPPFDWGNPDRGED